jgi:GNAT superfamily N-acetyltransferase
MSPTEDVMHAQDRVIERLTLGLRDAFDVEPGRVCDHLRATVGALRSDQWIDGEGDSTAAAVEGGSWLDAWPQGIAVVGDGPLDALPAVIARGRALGWWFLRLPLAWDDRRVDALRSSEWTQTHVLVRKRLESPRSLPALDDVSIRLAEPEDEAYLISAFRRALAAGLCPAERALTTESGLEVAATRRLRALLRPGFLGLIAMRDGERIGHSTAQLEAVDPLLGVHRPQLVDTWVEPEQQGRGIARNLTAWLEATAHRLGCTELHGTIGGADVATQQTLVSTLVHTGWEPVTRWMLHPLRSAPHGEPG